MLYVMTECVRWVGDREKGPDQQWLGVWMAAEVEVRLTGGMFAVANFGNERDSSFHARRSQDFGGRSTRGNTLSERASSGARKNSFFEGIVKNM